MLHGRIFINVMQRSRALDLRDNEGMVPESRCHIAHCLEVGRIFDE
jgi:hypothetical protein